MPRLPHSNCSSSAIRELDQSPVGKASQPHPSTCPTHTFSHSPSVAGPLGGLAGAGLAVLFCGPCPWVQIAALCLSEGGQGPPSTQAAFKGPYWLGSCRDGLSCPAALCCMGSTLKQANGSWDPSQKPALTQTPHPDWGWHQALLPHYLWPGKGLTVSRKEQEDRSKTMNLGGYLGPDPTSWEGMPRPGAEVGWLTGFG